MEYNFYQINNKVLVLDPYNEKDIDYIRFNHYVMRKENLQRKKEELDRGVFKISYVTAINDLKIGRSKLQRIVKWFVDNGIIECIEKSKSRDKASVYAYTTVYYENVDGKNSTDNSINSSMDSNTDLFSNSNRFNDMSNTDNNTDRKNNTDNSINYHTDYNTNNHTNLFSNSNRFDSVSNTDSNTDNSMDSGINNGTSKKEKEKENRKRASIAAATSSSLACTGKVFKGKTKVKCKYNGATITATRFDALSHHYRKQENIYTEKNGFIYEISRGEAKKADRYKSNNSSIRVHDAFSTKKETDFEEITEQIQYF